MRFALVVIFLLVGCASAPPLNTPSHRPEVTISGVSRKAVVDLIVNQALSNGNTLKKADEYSVVITRVDDSFLGAVLFGSRYDIHPEGRVTYTLVETSGSIRVFATIAIVRNPNSAFEAVTDITEGNAAPQAQAFLERLKTKAEENTSLQRGAAALPDVPTRNTSAAPTQPPRPGASKYLYSAEQFAKANGCTTPVVTLNLQSAVTETFSVICASGEPITVRCENGQCRTLK
jgi:hypothetical protein